MKRLIKALDNLLDRMITEVAKKFPVRKAIRIPIRIENSHYDNQKRQRRNK